MAPELAPALERSREAASEVADNWDRTYRRADRPVISLNAVKLNEKGDPIEAVTTASLNTVLSEGQRIVLEAPAGSGKTTTLVQLARHALGAGRLAFLVDLPDWVRSGKDILSYIAERPQFASRDVDATLLSKLRGDQPPIFLLNGWNEVPVAGAEAADAALRELDRSFSAAIVIVATRKHSLVPQLRGSFRLELNPLGATAARRISPFGAGRIGARPSGQAQQQPRAGLDHAHAAVPRGSCRSLPFGKGHPGDENGRARRRDGCDRAVPGTPDQSAASTSARTRARVSPLAFDGDDRARRNHDRRSGRTGGDEFRERETHVPHNQIADTPDPGEILDELSKRHVLVRAEDGEISFRFQHQQFQEFFAAGGLGARLVDLVRAKDSNGRPELPRVLRERTAVGRVIAHAGRGHRSIGWGKGDGRGWREARAHGTRG